MQGANYTEETGVGQAFSVS